MCTNLTLEIDSNLFLIVEWCGDGISGKYGLIRMVRQ